MVLGVNITRAEKHTSAPREVDKLCDPLLGVAVLLRNVLGFGLGCWRKDMKRKGLFLPLDMIMKVFQLCEH